MAEMELLGSLMGSATAAVHADGLFDGLGTFSTAHDIAPPMGLSTTFEQAPPDAGAGGTASGHVYSRITAPTRARCEHVLGSIEGAPGGEAAHVLLYSSGLAAIFAALTRLLPERVAISGGYHGTHDVMAQLRRISGGVRCNPVPLPPPEDVAGALKEGDVLWIETPRNPDCKISDIAAYVAAAKQAGVRVVVDSTFAPPPLQRPLQLGVDMVMHSTTKYMAGHSDALGGALCVADASVAAELHKDRLSMGNVPGSMEVWLLMRSLRTLHLRVERQSQTAARLASWLSDAVAGSEGNALSGLVTAVHHPSLPSHPSHEVAVRQMPGGFGGVLALELCSEAAAKALPAALRLFKDATSLGGVESLVEWRHKWDSEISPLLLRVSTGLEDFEHLKNDLQRAIIEVSNP